MSHLKNFFVGIVFPIILGMIIAGLLKSFVFEFNIVKGESMLPTLQDNDYLLTEKISYEFGKPHRGDIVIVKAPEKYLIKRVIGLPNDTVEIKNVTENNQAHKAVFVNGKQLKEPYIKEPMLPDDQNNKYVLGKDEVFVMGDNRNNSADSRFYGAFKLSDLVGKVKLEVKDNFKWY